MDRVPINKGNERMFGVWAFVSCRDEAKRLQGPLAADFLHNIRGETKAFNCG